MHCGIIIKKLEARIEFAEIKFFMGCSRLYKEGPYKKC
jgi:hypothetical protein